jgi:hypothetical protein
LTIHEDSEENKENIPPPVPETDPEKETCQVEILEEEKETQE